MSGYMRAKRGERGGAFRCVRCGTVLRRQLPPTGKGALHIVCPGCRYTIYDYPRPCVGVIVVKGDALLMLTRGHLPKRGWYDVPGGFLEPGEDIEKGARRELLEETGLRVGRVRSLGMYWDRYHLRGFGYFPTMNFYFLGRWRSGVPRAGDDAADASWVPIRQLGRTRSRWAWKHMHDVFRDVRKLMRA